MKRDYTFTYLRTTLFLFAMAISAFGYSQDEKTEKVEIDGEVFQVLIENNDTIILASLTDVSFAMPKEFKSKEEARHFRLTRARAVKVYPYAVKAIAVFRDIQEFSKDHKKRQNKKYIKQLHKDLREEFQKPLKNLSRSQGKVLVEMIERELGISTFKLIKQLKGGFKAVYWNNAAKLFGYKLKKGYDPEEDPILEMVLATFDISHDID
ncbi:MAG: DUF4294 domain-containing protein [Bacteroidota bacterium]